MTNNTKRIHLFLRLGLVAMSGLLVGALLRGVPVEAQAPGGGGLGTQESEAALDCGQEEFIADVPNVEWGGLDPAGRERATRLMNAHNCPCGCAMNLARCRRDDQSCSHSPVLAAGIIAAIEQGKTEAEVIRSLSLAPVGSQVSPDGSFIARVKVDLQPDDPSIGPPDAPVTLVEYIDYQCPFCTRAHATVEQMLQKYGPKLRVVFKQNPLPFHSNAPLAAQAALAAAAQGKFRPMHNLLIANEAKLTRQEIAELARQGGLDLAAFEAALDSGRFAAKVQEDAAGAERVRAIATPYFFINDRPLRGAQPLAAFGKLIDEELSGNLKPTQWVARAETPRPPSPAPEPQVKSENPPAGRTANKSGKEGDPILQKLEELHNEIKILRGEVAQLRRALAEIRAAAAPRPNVASPPAPQKIALDSSEPVLGNAGAKIAIVEFSDYQCPFCSRYHNQTFSELKKSYIDTGKVQYIFRDFPLPIHPQARGAAIAANCAGKQGAYWKMHHSLFTNQQRLGPDLYGELSESFQLDKAAFLNCLKEAGAGAEVDKDLAYGQSIGVRGTPSFFVGRVEGGQLVNVKAISGAQPFAVFSQTIESLLK